MVGDNRSLKKMKETEQTIKSTKERMVQGRKFSFVFFFFFYHPWTRNVLSYVNWHNGESSWQCWWYTDKALNQIVQRLWWCECVLVVIGKVFWLFFTAQLQII